MSDYPDPYGEDNPAARERAARRAERERRRAERRQAAQQSLGERVKEQAPAPAAAADGAEAETVATGGRAQPPAASRDGAAAPSSAPPEGQPPAAPPRSDGPPPAAPPPDGQPPAAPQPPPARPPGPAVSSGRGGSPRGPLTRGPVYRRRVLALLGIGVLAFVALVVVVIARGGEEPAPVAPVKAQRTTELLVPEGLSREQIAEVLKEEGIKGDYEKETTSFRGFDPGKYGAEAAGDLEGFLFPATYEIFRRDTAKDVVAKQLDAFEENFSGLDLDYAKSKNLTPYDVIIIASMIEREIALPEERKLAAAVIYNRLGEGMPLGIDATIRFATGNYDEPLKQSELELDSPYNTRVNTGLPPGPIGNPGLASLEAAAKPAKSSALYYVIEPGTCNEHFFTNSEKEFLAAADEYQAALEAEGGSPTDC